MRTHRLIILAILIGCKVAAPKTNTTDVYSEDLSVLRPTNSQNSLESDTAIQIQTEKFVMLDGHLKTELDSIAKISYEINKKGKLVEGFVIQVYSGNDRDEANNIRNAMYRNFSELKPKVSYYQPSFRVQAGQFTDRLEANRIHKEVKKEFPRALLIPERFKVVYE